MPGQAHLEITGEAVATLEAALAALGEDQDLDGGDHGDAPSKRDVQQAADGVKAHASKVALLAAEAGIPAAASAVAQLQQAALAFCARCYAAARAGAGPTLRKEVRKLAAGVLEPSIGLIRALEGGATDLKRHVGLVWQGCDAAAKAALDNRGALFKSLAGVMAVLKDTQQEMEELAEGSGSGEESEGGDDEGGGEASARPAEQAGSGAASAAAASPSGRGGGAAAGSGSGGGGGGEKEEGTRSLRELADLDFDAGELNKAEGELLAAARQLLEAAAAVVKAFGRALLQGPALAPGEALDGWESALYHARHLQRCAEDLGAAMYPPQDIDEALSAAEGLATGAELMADECPAPEAVGAGALADLAKAVEAAHARVQEAAAAAGAAEGGTAAAAGSEGS